VLVLVVGLGAQVVRADPLETLLMPGEVSLHHADIEKDCAECHRPFQRSAQSGLCLVCHEPVSDDISAAAGLHGRSGARDSDCASCHTEHKGRDADISGLDPETFDHGLSDFPLHGSHSSVTCRSCHQPGRSRRQAAQDCVTCHRDDDAHGGRLGESCADCHGETSWRSAKFDHSKTAFALEGEHERVACANCHPAERYEKTPTDCASCHAINDVHAGRFGAGCGDCHSPVEWKRVAFDHDADTKFPLRASHERVDCDSCHTASLEERRPKRDCYSCHQLADTHKRRFGVKCETCHDESSWRTEKFDHAAATEFPLRGRHQRLDCESCHRAALDEEKLGTACQNCHMADDVHAGQQGDDCSRCHAEDGWQQQVFFDHDLARFPLLGLHAVAACAECHSGATFRDASSDCSVCHEAHDFHEQRLGSACETCHNPNGWSYWRFDHDLQTQFRLEGAHTQLGCHQCHVRRVEGSIELSARCQTCHEQDDPHRGGFGRDCERCHVPEGWQRIRPGQ
jgi:hypothetical protein